ncbi:Mini-circle protein [Streptomyces sp. CB02923]|uniref:DinB family protein n=1 Tax=Streptomyces sp. CB02923 TaxID=1718985 RepID=UPI00093E4A19|nr:DinB family protein [Streptomyces sp. CB02923]OKI05004.1 Mini-circle protein [Streptomyces sp. CB02923]
MTESGVQATDPSAVPPENYAPVWADGGGARQQPPLVGGEREILTGYLEWHRATFELKCSGVPAERLSERTVPPSGMSLHGLIRHLAGVERWWFHLQFAGERTPMLYYSDEDPDQDFGELSGDPAQALEVWREQCEHSRRIVAAAPSLDVTGTHAASGGPVSLRRVLVGLIAEYAQHNGHADLLRERIDGAAGR